MGRIQEALHRAEIDRDNRRTKPRQLVRLMHLSGSLEGREQRFPNESILIGRGQHNDVAFDPFDDSTVSAQHAEIRMEGEDFVLYDMGSLNGTFLNGFSVRRAVVRPGDEVTLGRNGPKFEFQVDRHSIEVAAGPSNQSSPPHMDISQDDFPDTEKTPIQLAETVKTPNTLLFVILIGIVLDILINFVRMF